ncbi:MAG: membrane protein insertase YidC [Gammaproteobacteria bacterium]
MDLQKLFLFIALSIVLLLIWDAWQKDFGHQAPVPTQASAPGQHDAAPGTAPRASDVPTVAPSASTPASTASANGAPSTAPAAQPAEVLKQGQRIHVRTDTLDVTIDTVGGDIRRVDLPKYPVSVNKPNQPFVLMDDTSKHLFVAQSGFAQKAGVKVNAPNHTATYTAERTNYELAPGQKTLNVDLHWTGRDGVSITKRYTFMRDRYVVKMAYIVHNGGAQPWEANAYEQLQRTKPPKKSHFGEHTYTGAVYWSPDEHYQKVSFGDMEDGPLKKQFKGGWAAMIQHYFLGAWIPAPDMTFHYYTQAENGGRYIIGMYSPQLSVAPGQTRTLDASSLFVGPKVQKRLAAIAPGLDLTVDYGYLTFISKPLYWLLEKIHNIVGNWGWAIVLLTILIKAVFYKLSETSYKSMANMRRVQPRMKAIKERFAGDRQRQNQAMMELYKKEKINPLGGCLPIAIQIPVFIALYWVLLESVELRQADWILWIHDLSTKDPYYVLPIVMGITMLLQQRLNPTPMDPIQAKVMMVLPIAFTVFFAFFPAGLVIYWIVNNSLSILQQWYITRVVLKVKT